MEIRVLVVDDHEFVRDTVSSALQGRAGIRVVGQACNGLEAIEFADRVRPDVILMDLVMPILDGVAATLRLREREPRIRIVVFTSGASGRLEQAALAAGAVSIVYKGADIDAVVEAVLAAAALAA
jgi:NarL family two-component system response regulator LiaR